MPTNCNLIFKLDNVIKLNKFFKFDGYPAYAGNEIIKFINRNEKPSIVSIIKNRLDYISREEYDDIIHECGGSFFEDLVLFDHEEAQKCTKLYPGVSDSTDICGFLLILESLKEERLKVLSSDFVTRWTYVVDLDEDKFYIIDASKWGLDITRINESKCIIFSSSFKDLKEYVPELLKSLNQKVL